MKLNDINIKTYNGTPSGTAVYVLSRGTNSGKVLDAPCPNCYEITAAAEVLPKIRAVAQILFCSGHLRQYLHGSVIEFVRIEHYRLQFYRFWNNISPDVLEKTAEALNALDLCQVATLKKLKLIKEMRLNVARTVLK